MQEFTVKSKTAFSTQRNFEVAEQILKSFNDLSPAARAHLLNSLKRSDEKIRVKESASIVKSADDLIAEYKDKQLIFEGLPTGIPTLDKYLLGLKQGDVLVVGAYTGLGKSTLLMYMALYLQTQGVNSVMFALEDSEYEVGTRAAFLSIGNNELAQPHTGQMFLFGKDGVPLLYKNKFAFIPAVEAVVAAKGVKVVFLDMLNDILDPISDKDADDFMVELKYLADRLGIVMVITSRLREPAGLSEKTRRLERVFPSEDALYGRSMIKFLATKIITIAESPTYPYEPATGMSKHETRHLCIHVVKNRLGKTTKGLGGAVGVSLVRSTVLMSLKDNGFEQILGGEDEI